MIKKLFILFSFLIFTLSPFKTFAEVESITNFGTYIIGLDNIASFNTYSGELFKDNKNNFGLNRGISLDTQFIVFRGLAVGGTFSLNYYEYETSFLDNFGTTTYQTTSKNIIFGLGPSLFYYYQINNIVPFLGFQFLYSFRNTKFISDDTNSELIKYNLNLYTYSVKIGLSYLITEYLAVYISYSYNREMNKMINVKVFAAAADDIIFYYNDKRNKEIWGNINSLNIGVKFFIN